ncbi:MAG: DNA recombination protein RmuC [Gammaproteobacteria bacterium]|nr:DNA recombination protein RmuC [Gammaproteobacteria bacterium]
MPIPLTPWLISLLTSLGFILLGVICCFIVMRYLNKQQSNALQTIFNIKEQQLEQAVHHCEDQLDKLHLEYHLAQQKIETLQQNNSELFAQVRELTATADSQQQAHQEQLSLVSANHESIKHQFSHLAQQILEQKGQMFQQQNKSSMDALLAPLQQQLHEFKNQIQHSLESETKQRQQLQHELGTLQQLNQQMATDAVNLTRALKGDNKQQGNWGELILERILQESGLRQGHEYHTQSQHHNEQGKAFRPDVIVHLPDQKDIIVDSKVSLTAYERYFNSDDEMQQQLALNEHINSIKQHIKELGNKDYHQLKGLRSLDYVLLFIPIEPAFLLAIEHQPDLISYAMNHNIMLVSPTNLLVALRTIHNLWRYDQQNKNSQLIANKAAKLYDKLRLFSDDLLSIGHSLSKANHSYEQAVKKLSSGKGNLISQVESFRALGVEVKKPISLDLVNEQSHLIPPHKEDSTQ